MQLNQNLAYLKKYLQNNPVQTGTLAVSGVLVVALITYVLLLQVNFTIPAIKEQAYSNVSKSDPFARVVLEARSAYVFDIRQGVELFSLNGEAQLPLASVTKLMTALVAAETLNERGSITIKSSDIAQDGDSGFAVGERFMVGDLLDFTLLESSNDGAHALAGAAGALLYSDASLPSNPRPLTAFIRRMNEKAYELGLIQSFYTNPTGLDSGEYTSGGYGSARDTALLLEYIMSHLPGTLSATPYEVLELTSSNTTHIAHNTNTAVYSMPGLLASKTGYTDLAGGNLAIVFDAGINYPIAIVVLGSTIEGRFRDVEKLVWASLKAIQD